MNQCKNFCNYYVQQKLQEKAMLVPKLNGPGDTKMFLEFDEDDRIFDIASHSAHAKDFADF